MRLSWDRTTAPSSPPIRLRGRFDRGGGGGCNPSITTKWIRNILGACATNINADATGSIDLDEHLEDDNRECDHDNAHDAHQTDDDVIFDIEEVEEAVKAVCRIGRDAPLGNEAPVIGGEPPQLPDQQPHDENAQTQEGIDRPEDMLAGLSGNIRWDDESGHTRIYEHPLWLNGGL